MRGCRIETHSLDPPWTYKGIHARRASSRCCHRGAVSAKAHLAVVSWFSLNTLQKNKIANPQGRDVHTRCCVALDGKSL